MSALGILNIEIEFDDLEKKVIQVSGTMQNLKYLDVFMKRCEREREQLRIANVQLGKIGAEMYAELTALKKQPKDGL